MGVGRGAWRRDGAGGGVLSVHGGGREGRKGGCMKLFQSRREGEGGRFELGCSSNKSETGRRKRGGDKRSFLWYVGVKRRVPSCYLYSGIMVHDVIGCC